MGIMTVRKLVPFRLDATLFEILKRYAKTDNRNINIT